MTGDEREEVPATEPETQDKTPEAPVDDGPLTDEDVVAAIEEASTKPEEPEPEPEQPEGEPAKAEGEPEPPAPDAEAEIKSMGLKDRAAERFREMSTEIRTLRETLETAGVKDLAELPTLVQRAQYADQLMQDIVDTGATPEQYSKSLSYLADVHAAASGDREAAERAFETLLPEVQALASLLGKDIAGVADPLAQHEDLAEAVENGEITRQYALQLAATRAQGQVQQQRQQQTRQQQEAQAAVQQADEALRAFDMQMQQVPGYAHKRPILDAQMQMVRQNVHPSRWVEAATAILARIPDIAPPPAPKPTPGPVRSGRPAPANLAPEHADVFDAIEYASSHR
ncbi:hypothetical protein MASR1M8_15960 [Thermomonas brevis]